MSGEYPSVDTCIMTIGPRPGWGDVVVKALPLHVMENGITVLVWHADGRFTADADGKQPLTNADAAQIYLRVMKCDKLISPAPAPPHTDSPAP
jgi:hypothetical protein